MKAVQIDVSVIICTRNRAEHLAPTLASIDEVCVPPGTSVEVLVIDNGSTDGTAALLASNPMKRLPMRSLFYGQPGKCRAQNFAIAESTGSVLLWTDDDVRVRPDWLKLMTSPILAGRQDALQGQVLIPDHLRAMFNNTPMATRMSIFGSTENLDFSNPDAMYGPNMSFGRHVLQAIPEFDENLGPGPTSIGYGDETLFSYRLIAAGFRFGGVPESVVEHHFDPKRVSQDSIDAIARKIGTSRAYIEYHWKGRRVKAPGLQIARCRATYVARRLGHTLAAAPPPSRAELRYLILEWTAYLEQFRRMQSADRMRPHH